jgi:hypothetical protein
MAISAIRHLFNNSSLLAEFQVSIERAASVLDGIAKMNGHAAPNDIRTRAMLKKFSWGG